MVSKDEQKELLKEKQRASDERNNINLEDERKQTQGDIARIKAEAQRNSIRNQISNKEREIADLGKRISEFKEMKNEIAQAISSLNFAKINLSIAADKINISLVTLRANKWINNCNDEMEQIESLISNLNNTLSEIEKEVHSINIEIIDKENEVVLLYGKLNAL